MPGVIVADDGDGHYFAYRFTGKAGDALAALAPLFRRDDHIVVADGPTSLTTTNVPDDFWIADGDDFSPNLAAYPSALAY
jgi:hypothetical protein